MIEKIDELKPCFDPEHNPPNNIYLTPGKYKHTCPRCKNVIYFEVMGTFSGKATGLRIDDNINHLNSSLYKVV